MSLKAEDVVKIAHLARIEIKDEEIESYTSELSEILGFVERLNAADTKGVTPMAHPLDQVQRLRVDEVTEEDQRELFQSIAPETENGLYLVPQVIE
ncbi:MAG: Asp-tRNA(Asn)/Glu-tRNA(Gln) amidotransferase GatCAB subunit C [Gammaproteobacteria bacterium]|nr:MAG: Asp-tRNA(Asn)/Glu-tRNA(Gln) amidotransferase GatCAB subunit C [Gammaproteobacteria bacterium]